MSIPLISRPHGYVQMHFYAQECVKVNDLYGTLIDIQAGKALVVLFEEYRAEGSNGVLECSLDSIEKLY